MHMLENTDASSKVTVDTFSFQTLYGVDSSLYSWP